MDIVAEPWRLCLSSLLRFILYILMSILAEGISCGLLSSNFAMKSSQIVLQAENNLPHKNWYKYCCTVFASYLYIYMCILKKDWREKMHIQWFGKMFSSHNFISIPPAELQSGYFWMIRYLGNTLGMYPFDIARDSKRIHWVFLLES